MNVKNDAANAAKCFALLRRSGVLLCDIGDLANRAIDKPHRERPCVHPIWLLYSSTHRPWRVLPKCVYILRMRDVQRQRKTIFFGHLFFQYTFSSGEKVGFFLAIRNDNKGTIRVIRVIREHTYIIALLFLHMCKCIFPLLFSSHFVHNRNICFALHVYC